MTVDTLLQLQSPRDSGFYLGYWGSTLSYRSAGADSDGFENDFYGGYARSVGRFNYSLGLI